METKTSTFHVICKKGDHTKMVADNVLTMDKDIPLTGDIDVAYTSRTPKHLFLVLEEYRPHFKDDFEVVKVEEIRTVEYKSLGVVKP